MNTYWLSVGLLATLFSVPPILRRLALIRTLRELKVEGATVTPRFWRPGRILYRRAKWDADVLCRPPGEISGGGPRGHLDLVGRLRRSTPGIDVHLRGHSHGAPAAEGGATGDPRFDQVFSFSGDAVFASLLFSPEVRDLVLRLHGMEGRLGSVRDGVVTMTGPLGRGPVEIRQFLGTCELLLDHLAQAVSTLPEKV
jgi:hypothetical protein